MRALFDTLLPGDAEFPAAGTLTLDMAGHERFGPALVAVQALLPEGFDTQSPEARITTLQGIEAAHRSEFDALILGLYSLYYTHPEVSAVIRNVTGHSGAPPQPLGHDLAPFDPAMLAIPAARAPLYRPTPKVPHED